VQHRRQRGHGRPDPGHVGEGAGMAGSGDGVPADQPPARLPTRLVNHFIWML